MTDRKRRFIGLIAFVITGLIFCLYSFFLRLTFSPSSLYSSLQFYHRIGQVLILILALVYINEVLLLCRLKFSGIMTALIGTIMLIFSLFFLGMTLPSIIMLIFSLFSIYLGLRSFQASGGMTLPSIIMLIFSLLSILFGLRFFSHSWLQIYYRIAQVLILISGIVYIISSLFLLRLKNWARKLVLRYSVVLILYFIPLSIFLIPDPWGWGKFMALSFSTYIIFPLFFIIFFTRHKVKEQFKK